MIKKFLATTIVCLAFVSFADMIRANQAASSMMRNRTAIHEYTAKDYIQDGLVAIWDGIENVGYGLHDDDATIWKDCINGRIWKGISTIYNGNSYISKGGNSTDTTFVYQDLIGTERAREVVFKANSLSFSNDPLLSATGDRSLDFGIWCGRDMFLRAYYRNGQYFLNVSNNDAYQCFCLVVVNMSNSTI